MQLNSVFLSFMADPPRMSAMDGNECRTMSVKLLEITARAEDTAADGHRGSQQVQPTEDGVAVVAEFPARPLNLITIWGAARSGKSYFLNVLAQHQRQFRVSAAVEPCTVGADLSLTAPTLCDFKGSVDSSCTNPGDACQSCPLIGFVDVEGQGDQHISYDVLLGTPILLLSKVGMSLSLHIAGCAVELINGRWAVELTRNRKGDERKNGESSRYCSEVRGV